MPVFPNTPLEEKPGGEGEGFLGRSLTDTDRGTTLTRRRSLADTARGREMARRGSLPRMPSRGRLSDAGEDMLGSSMRSVSIVRDTGVRGIKETVEPGTPRSARSCVSGRSGKSGISCPKSSRAYMGAHHKDDHDSSSDDDRAVVAPHNMTRRVSGLGMSPASRMHKHLDGQARGSQYLNEIRRRSSGADTTGMLGWSGNGSFTNRDLLTRAQSSRTRTLSPADPRPSASAVNEMLGRGVSKEQVGRRSSVTGVGGFDTGRRRSLSPAINPDSGSIPPDTRRSAESETRRAAPGTSRSGRSSSSKPNLTTPHQTPRDVTPRRDSVHGESRPKPTTPPPAPPQLPCHGVVVAASGRFLRPSPGENDFRYGRVEEREEVTVIDRDGQWLLVTAGPKRGWMQAKYVEFKSSKVPAPTGAKEAPPPKAAVLAGDVVKVTVRGGRRLRQAPKQEIYNHEVDQGEELAVRAVEGEWLNVHRVKKESEWGWIRAEYVGAAVRTGLNPTTPTPSWPAATAPPPPFDGAAPDRGESPGTQRDRHGSVPDNKLEQLVAEERLRTLQEELQRERKAREDAEADARAQRQRADKLEEENKSLRTEIASLRPAKAGANFTKKGSGGVVGRRDSSGSVDSAQGDGGARTAGGATKAATKPLSTGAAALLGGRKPSSFNAGRSPTTRPTPR
eukprot:Hpha_TRINITY_DN9092_c0_g1::TRINITY_DN9092_c0_g1_i1::g.141812::m.141812